MAETTRIMAAGTPRERQIAWTSGLDAIAGLWLFLSAFFIPETETAYWNFIIVGVAVASLALGRSTGAFRSPAVSWFNALLGVWLIISPWPLDYATDSDSLWNAVITGMVIVLLAASSAMAGRRTAPRRDERVPPPPPQAR